MRKHKGIFITFESTAEGLGKTTQARRLYDNLSNAGYDVVLTREPGGTELGEQIRTMLKTPRPKGQELSNATEVFLTMAFRAQHYVELLKPALRAGKVVISDRYFDSTLMYQGSGRGWKTAFLWRLHHAATGSLLPDITFVLDGSTYKQIPDQDRFETMRPELLAKMKRDMLHRVAKDGRYELVNANQPKDDIAQMLFDTVTRRFPNA